MPSARLVKQNIEIDDGKLLVQTERIECVFVCVCWLNIISKEGRENGAAGRVGSQHKVYQQLIRSYTALTRARFPTLLDTHILIGTLLSG